MFLHVYITLSAIKSKWEFFRTNNGKNTSLKIRSPFVQIYISFSFSNDCALGRLTDNLSAQRHNELGKKSEFENGIHFSDFESIIYLFNNKVRGIRIKVRLWQCVLSSACIGRPFASNIFWLYKIVWVMIFAQSVKYTSRGFLEQIYSFRVEFSPS